MLLNSAAQGILSRNRREPNRLPSPPSPSFAPPSIRTPDGPTHLWEAGEAERKDAGGTGTDIANGKPVYRFPSSRDSGSKVQMTWGGGKEKEDEEDEEEEEEEVATV